MTTRLFHISDVHFGVEDRAALDEVARAISEERPDALVCTGDLTQRATHRQYAAAEEWFAQVEVPVWLQPGNHDMPYYNLAERFADPFKRYRKLCEAVGCERFESDDLVLIPLNSNVPAQRRWPWSDGVVTRTAIDETLRHLGAIEVQGRSIIIAAHHPLLGPKPEGPNPTVGGETAFAELAREGADAFLSGHVHFPIDELREARGEAARLIGAGTLSTRLRNRVPPSYNVLTCEKGKGIAVELRVLEPGGR